MARMVLYIAVLHHLRGGAGHHQQRAGDGDAASGCRRSAPCGRSAPSGASSWRMLMIEAVVIGPGLRRCSARWLGAGIVGRWSARWASPPANDVLYFFFSGPRLHPDAGRRQPGRRRFVIVLVVSAHLQPLSRPGWRCGSPRARRCRPRSEGPCPSPCFVISRSPFRNLLQHRRRTAVPGRRHRRRHRAAGPADGSVDRHPRARCCDTATTLVDAATSTWAASSR